MTHIKENITRMAESWFLEEPALFSIFCTHQLVENASMACVCRSGKGRIEYNPMLLQKVDEETADLFFRAEVLRIMLKHPYERQPSNCPLEIITLASECVLSSYYNKIAPIMSVSPKSFNFPERKSFEWYAKMLQQLFNPDENNEECPQAGASSDNDDQPGVAQKSPNSNGIADQSMLWEEDEMMTTLVNDAIRDITSWGMLPNNLVSYLIASTKAKVDYRRVLHGFRSSVLSSKRYLTRMKPSRRKEFEQMGSRYLLASHILVAIDVSASVTDKSLADFFTIINRFFRYGIEQISVVQFDAELKEIELMRKARPKVKVTGRGGTNFQPIFDHVFDAGKYDGLIILTDGNAPPPKIPRFFHTPVMWICQDETAYTKHRSWMGKIGRVCCITC